MNTHSPQVETATDPHPLVTRLLRYTPLTGAELSILHALGAETRTLRAGELFVAEGSAEPNVFVLQAGAVFSALTLKGGARQILRIHHPGDLMNTTSVAWTRAAASLTAATPARIAPFPRVRLGEIFSTAPRVAAMLYGMSVVDNVSLNDRLASLGRTDGRARIATLLLELNARQRVNDRDQSDVIDLFLTQNEIADAVGMTKVHVNRLLRELTEEGLIERQGRRVRLARRDALVAACDFVDRYESMATDWWPAS